MIPMARQSRTLEDEEFQASTVLCPAFFSLLRSSEQIGNCPLLTFDSLKPETFASVWYRGGGTYE
jgi:hypothetical protein